MTATRSDSESPRPIEEDPVELSDRPAAISATRPSGPGDTGAGGAGSPTEPQIPVAVPSGQGRTVVRRGGPAVMLAISASLLLIGLAIGLLIASPSSDLEVIPADGTAEVLDLRAVSAGSPALGALEVRNGSGAASLELSVSGLAASKPGGLYTAWLRDGSRSLALGGFRVGPSRAADAVFPLPVRLRRFSRFEIRRERSDGDPGPGGRAVLRVPTE